MRLCKHCRDAGWVCETHPNKPWSGTKGCNCGAAGMPCPTCAKDDEWDRPPDYAQIFQSADEAAGKKMN